MSHGVVCKYHYRENFRVWLTSVTVWLFFREGVAKCPCKCGSVSEIYKIKADFNELYRLMNGMELQEMDKIIYPVCKLCRDHERSGFTEGIKIGIMLARELS